MHREFELSSKKLDTRNPDLICRPVGTSEGQRWGCVLERAAIKYPSKRYSDLLDDGLGEEESYVVDFVNPNDPRMITNVRQIRFSICGGNYGYDCPGKPAGFLQVDRDEITTRKEALDYFIQGMTLHL